MKGSFFFLITNFLSLCLSLDERSGSQRLNPQAFGGNISSNHPKSVQDSFQVSREPNSKEPFENKPVIDESYVYSGAGRHNGVVYNFQIGNWTNIKINDSYFAHLNTSQAILDDLYQLIRSETISALKRNGKINLSLFEHYCSLQTISLRKARDVILNLINNKISQFTNEAYWSNDLKKTNIITFPRFNKFIKEKFAQQYQLVHPSFFIKYRDLMRYILSNENVDQVDLVSFTNFASRSDRLIFFEEFISHINQALQGKFHREVKFVSPGIADSNF